MRPTTITTTTTTSSAGFEPRTLNVPFEHRIGRSAGFSTNPESAKKKSMGLTFAQNFIGRDQLRSEANQNRSNLICFKSVFSFSSSLKTIHQFISSFPFSFRCRRIQIEVSPSIKRFDKKVRQGRKKRRKKV